MTSCAKLVSFAKKYHTDGALKKRPELFTLYLDHRSNPSVCGQLAALIAQRVSDSVASRTAATRTEIVVWEGTAKGIDDAALAGIPLSAINVRRWYQTLEGDSLERVKDVWGRLAFKP